MSSPLKIVAHDAAGLTKGLVGTALAASFCIGCVGAASFLSYMVLREPGKAIEYLNATLSLRGIPLSDTARGVATFINWSMLTAMGLYVVTSAFRVYHASLFDRSRVARLQQEARNALRQRQAARAEAASAEPEKMVVNS